MAACSRIGIRGAVSVAQRGNAALAAAVHPAPGAGWFWLSCPNNFVPWLPT